MPIRAPKGFIDESDPKVCQIGHPAPPWLVNYADLMTELVCFFVILYALSAALNKNMTGAQEELKKMMENKEIENVSTEISKDGLKISLEEQKEKAFFQSGSADTTPEIESVMDKIAPILKRLAEKQDINVEGHTDNLPIHNEYYDSNWELSTARATSVARLLIDKHGLDPKHVGAIGYGQYRGVAPNDSPENRAKNRRVVFFVKNAPLEKKATAPPPAAAVPPGETP